MRLALLWSGESVQALKSPTKSGLPLTPLTITLPTFILTLQRRQVGRSLVVFAGVFMAFTVAFIFSAPVELSLQPNPKRGE